MKLKDVRFHNPRLARVGVEPMTLAELRERAGAQLGVPERVDFLMLLLVEVGRTTHMVDFVELELRAGTVLLVRPGQVHQWRMTASLQGQLVLVSAEALAPSIARAQADMKLLALDEWPAASRPSRGLFGEALAGVARIRADVERFTGSEIDAALIRHELLALLLRLARERERERQAEPPNRESAIHRMFVRELEKSFHQRLAVLDYAKRLGYSESTVSRACVAAVGRSAKQLLDQRIALEAKRLLVHSEETVVQVGHQLGFSEPTNFVKFFRRTAGSTPQAFRAAARLRAPRRPTAPR